MDATPFFSRLTVPFRKGSAEGTGPRGYWPPYHDPGRRRQTPSKAIAPPNNQAAAGTGTTWMESMTPVIW